MVTREIEASKRKNIEVNRELEEIERWFRNDYVFRKLEIDRYQYLGLKPQESRYALEIEAYKKENRSRELQGLEPLPEVKIFDLFSNNIFSSIKDSPISLINILFINSELTSGVSLATSFAVSSI